MDKKAIFTIGFLALVGAVLFFFNRTAGPNSISSSSGGSGSQNTNGTVISGEFKVGKPAAEFTTVDFSGNKVSLSDFSGKGVVLDFWAAWCPFCVEELPNLEAVHKETKGKIVFLGIHRTDSGESIQKAKEFADNKGVTYLLLSDPTGKIYKTATQGLNTMPTAVFIDKNGIVKEIKLGPKTKEEIRNSVDKLLNSKS